MSWTPGNDPDQGGAPDADGLSRRERRLAEQRQAPEFAGADELAAPPAGTESWAAPDYTAPSLDDFAPPPGAAVPASAAPTTPGWEPPPAAEPPAWGAPPADPVWAPPPAAPSWDAPPATPVDVPSAPPAWDAPPAAPAAPAWDAPPAAPAWDAPPAAPSWDAPPAASWPSTPAPEAAVPPPSTVPPAPVPPTPAPSAPEPPAPPAPPQPPADEPSGFAALGLEPTDELSSSPSPAEPAPFEPAPFDPAPGLPGPSLPEPSLPAAVAVRDDAGAFEGLVDAGDARSPVEAPVDPIMIGASTPLVDFGDLSKPRPGEWIAFVLAFLLPPVGLIAGIAAAVTSSRRRGWTIGLDKATIAIAVVMSIVAGIAGVVAYGALEDARKFEATVAASAEFCGAVTADPGYLEQPIYGWPQRGFSIETSLVEMQAWVDRWDAFAAVAPAGVAEGVTGLADAGRTIVENVTVARQIDNDQNIEVIQSAVRASGVDDWVATYCTTAG